MMLPIHCDTCEVAIRIFHDRLWAIVVILGFIGAPNAMAGDITGSNAPVRAAAVPAKPGTCGSPEEFATKNCQLTWGGVTVYGTIDAGAMWQSHGTPYNGTLPAGVETVISKNSNRALWNLAPGALSQSNIGLKGNFPIASGWAAIFDLQGGFNPYSLQWANGPGAVAQNAGVPLTSQTSNGDLNREGQFYNSVGYLGLTSPYGTLTVFRQNALTLDGVIAYDPMVGSYAFSPIGYQGFACGAGVPETCRFNTSAKYRIDAGQFRFAALWQFAGYNEGNPSTGSYQLQFGADMADVAGGKFSFDIVGAYVKNAVAIALAGNALPSVLPQVLTATLSDDIGVMLLAKYSKGPIKLFSGYEYIRYAPPSSAFPVGTGFTNTAGDVICAGCSGINNTNINSTAFNAGDRDLHIFWAGFNFALTSEIELMAGYYHYYQPTFGAPVNCAVGPKPANCYGTFDAASLAIDWQFAEKFDVYAGFMFSQVNGGLANGYLNRNTIDPTIGLRFRF
ncbi:porin [Tardiphaga robiniae]|uniref:Porin n=1 Tax=Tardiphaga robiniae TaxID=943830 RepID=A0A7G6TTZ1_9BRAD|nr:porin [Tardiphaga robiniae]QND70223.1 porin [Tardiphaga robiniae]